MTESSPKLRVGMLGCAYISYKTVTAILSKDSNCEMTAIASRSLEKAQEFAKTMFGDDASKIATFGSYDELIASDLVEALYLPLPTTLHKEWVFKALRGGKHVVLEKPVAISSGEYAEMLAEAYKHNRFILDGTMFPHHPRTQQILDAVSSNKLGDVDRIEANFTFLADAVFQETNIRARKDADLLGAIGDLGWYCIRFAQMVFGQALGKKPVSAQVVDFKLSKHGVPLDATCVVRFEGGCVLWFHCGFMTAFRQRFEICGTQKSVILDDLVLPTKGPVSFDIKSSALNNYAILTSNEIEKVECEDCPVHEILLWAKFAEIVKTMDATSADATKWTTSNEDTAKAANGFADVSMVNQQIADALMKSLDGNCVSVDI